MKAVKTPEHQASPVNPIRKKRSEKRDRVLKSAIAILLEQGHEAMTLDAVAQAAEVSKGGLLYHFPSKEALILGIIQHLIDDFNLAIDTELAQETGDAPGKWLRAYVRATFRNSQIPLALGAGLFVAASTTLSPDAQKQVAEQTSQWKKRIDSSGLDPITADLIYLATEGLWSTEMFGENAPNPKRRKQILKRLLAMTDKTQ